MTESFFDVFFDFGGIINYRASGPTTVRWSEGIQGAVQIEIVSMNLTGKDLEGFPFTVTQSKERRSLGTARMFTQEADGTCVAIESFFDIFVDINFIDGTLKNATSIHMMGVGPIPIPPTRAFLFAQDPQIPAVLVDASGRRIGEIRNTRHSVPPPPPPPCPCFPRAGRDVMYSKLGHTIEIFGIGVIAPLMSGPVVVSRSDPYVDPTSGFCTIDTEMVSMSLSGFDPLVGPIKIALNPAKPSKGQIREINPGTCFPAESFFDVFIEVTLVNNKLSYVNCDPIRMECTINSLPPYGCPYMVKNPPITLFKTVPGADVCNLPGQTSAGIIREATHTPLPPPVCPPAPTVQTSDSQATIVVEVTGLGLVEAVLKGPTTCEIEQTTDLNNIPIEILSMDLRGMTPIGHVTLRKNPDPQFPSRGFAQNCRQDTVYGDIVADSFFDIFVEISLPDPQDPSEILILKNPVPVHMMGEGIPLIITRPLALTQRNPGVPLLDPAGNLVAAIQETIHQLPPPPPPPCDCFPRAGIDKFRSKLVHTFDIPGIGTVRADCDGPMEVHRGDPRIDPATGLCVIDTEIVNLLLSCNDPLVGGIEITLNRKRASIGTVAQLPTSTGCFPAESFFDIFIRVELKDLGIVLVNCTPIKMRSTILSLPPYPPNPAYSLWNMPVPLFREIDDPENPSYSVCIGTVLPQPVAFLTQATHTPLPPAGVCECFPKAGQDVMQTNLWHEINIFGVGICKAPLTGQTVVRRSDPAIDPTTGKCTIVTTMTSMTLSGIDPVCGDVRIELNTDPGRPSTGRIVERVPNTCFPADSFFDIFIKVRVGGKVYLNCKPAHMEAVIDSIPPWNAFYNLDLEGLELYQDSALFDPCTRNPVGSIGKALHVPRRPCTCFGAGKDIMDSMLAHRIDVLGTGLCDTPLHGRIEVTRGEPYLDDDGLCRVDTEMTYLELTGNDSRCGPMKIRLNPAKPTKGSIAQLNSQPGCFQAQSCFQVFIIAEAAGRVLENCEPIIMCTVINTIPPYEQMYLLKFGEVQLYDQGACDLPLQERQRHLQATILEDSSHTPKPCAPLSAACAVVNGHAQITVTLDPDCPCEKVVVTREDGTAIPASGTDPLLFIDPDQCVGVHTYTARCSAGGALSDGVICRVDCPTTCKFQDRSCTQEGNRIRVKWTTSFPGCCAKILLQLFCDGVAVSSIVLPGNQTEVIIDDCPEPCQIQKVVLTCIDSTGNPGDTTFCEIPCQDIPCKVLDLKCVTAPLGKGVRIFWTVDPDCPCKWVKILRNGAEIAVVPASDGAYFDPKDCPSPGQLGEVREYCVVCVDDNHQEIGPRVCCKVFCGIDPCPERHVQNLRCRTEGDPPVVILTWTQDQTCPCVRARIIRDGLVIGEVDANLLTFADPCIPGDHTYCVVCIDASGAVVGEPECCKVSCPPVPPVCDCPPAGIDRFRSSLIHLIDVPGIGQINASMEGPVVVSRGDPYINPASGLCCIKTKIEEMTLYGTDPLAGPIKIVLNPCRPSLGTICQLPAATGCFPARSCFDIFIRVELPALGLVLVNCDPIVMCSNIDAIPPFGRAYDIVFPDPTDPRLPLYKEVLDPTAPCRSVCDLPSGQRPLPVAFIVRANHTPKPPAPDCLTCFPPAGIDQMDTNLWHEIDIPGIGAVCKAGLSGTVRVQRFDPMMDPATGTCLIETEMLSMDLHGHDETCGDVAIKLNAREPSRGLIAEKVPGTCFPADSFFDIFIEVTVTPPTGGNPQTFVNCEPAHMIAEIVSIPPWNAFYNLSIEGLALYKLDPLKDVCLAPPQPAPAHIGQALHVPRQTCSCFGPGIDEMSSTLVHDIRFLGPDGRVCTAELSGLVKVERGEPYLDANGFCAVDTVMTGLDLFASDPVCGPIRIRLNPEQVSGGFIRQVSKASCFPATSCFKVFVEVEVLGMLLRNCEPAIMCCEIEAIPPYGCLYQLSFSGDPPQPLSLWNAPECNIPPSQRPPPIAEIIQIAHVPQEPCAVKCQLVGKDAVIKVTGYCPCQSIFVKRDDGAIIPASILEPRTFIDRECKGLHSYTAYCVIQTGADPTAIGTCVVQCAGLIRGDVNSDTFINITDAIVMLTCFFMDTRLCPNCTDVMDVNCADPSPNISDVIALLAFMYLGGSICPDPIDC